MIFTEEQLNEALKLHSSYSRQLAEIRRIENITKTKNIFKADILTQHQEIQSYLQSYFKSAEHASSQYITTGDDILVRREYRSNELDDEGNERTEDMINLGLQFIHDEFNDGFDFPLSTFFSLVANSGVGKSDYFYVIANALLMQGYKVLLCSFEFGEERLGRLIDSEENGGKDRMKESRLAGKFDNLIVNYGARTLDELELLIDTAHLNGVKAILVDSFGEIERNMSEYELQQKTAMMVNRKKNDYGMFLGFILQTKASEMDGDYTIRGGTDFIYKPDISIHVKKKNAEDTSGERIVHLFKNRDSDWNGKTIITKWNPIERIPVFKEVFKGVLASGETVRNLDHFKKTK